MGNPNLNEAAAAVKLAQVAQTAFDLFPKDCSHSVNYVLTQIVDPKQPYQVANALMATMSASKSGWRQVMTIEEASDLANRGKVVVGGLASPGHGHVLIVMPGAWHASGGYEAKGHMVAGKGKYPPSMSGALGDWPGASSRGEKTVRDPWTAADWKNVTFWTKP